MGIIENVLGGVGCGLADLFQGILTGIIDLILGGLGANFASGQLVQVGFMVVIVFLLYTWLRSHVIWLLLIFVVPIFLC